MNYYLSDFFDVYTERRDRVKAVRLVSIDQIDRIADYLGAVGYDLQTDRMNNGDFTVTFTLDNRPSIKLRRGDFLTAADASEPPAAISSQEFLAKWEKDQ